MIRPFFSEKELVKAFLHNSQLDIKSKYENWNTWEALELNGFFGIPDVVMAFGKIGASGQKIIRTYAFEMKLRNWKQALMQAYRYSAFSHYSIVVIDEAFIHPVISNIKLFKRSNIGLLTINYNGQIEWHYEPKYQTPYSNQLYEKLSNNLSQELFS